MESKHNFMTIFSWGIFHGFPWIPLDSMDFIHNCYNNIDLEVRGFLWIPSDSFGFHMDLQGSSPIDSIGIHWNP